MATTKYVINKLTKAGFEIEEERRGDDGHVHQYHAHKGDWTIRFHQQGGQVGSFYVKRDDQHDDMTTDYFAGSFRDNVTQAIGWVDYDIAREAKEREQHDAGECGGADHPGCRYHRADHETAQCIGRCWHCKNDARQVLMQMGHAVDAQGNIA